MAKKAKESIFVKTIADIVDAVGGRDNVASIFHCATRLRFTVIDKTKVSNEKLKQVHLSKGLNIQEDQYQLIFGSGTVNKVLDYWNKSGSLTGDAATFNTKAKQPYWNNKISFSANTFALTRRGIRGFAAIFIPLIPLFVAGGFCLAIKAMIQASIGFDVTSGTAYEVANVFDIIGGTVFSSLPIFVGITASKLWGGNKWYGAAIGACLVAPGLMNSWTTQAVGTIWIPLGESPTSTEIMNSFMHGINDQDWFNNNLYIIGGYDKVGANDVYEYIQWCVNGTNGLTDANLSNVIFDTNSSLVLSGKVAAGTGILAYATSNVAVGYTLFGSIGFFTIQLIGYQAQVFTTLLVIALSVVIQKGLDKVIPDSISLIITPLLTVFISVYCALWFIGPFGRLLTDGISFVFTSLIKYTNYKALGLGSALFSFFYAPLVMTGLHQGLLPIKATMIAQYGVEIFTPMEICANISQGFITLMMALYIVNSKKPKIKSEVISGGISASCGITEPALFGCTIQCKHAFLAAMIGAFFGGWWVGMTQCTALTLGISSWIGLVQFSPNVVNLDSIYDPVANYWKSLPYNGDGVIDSVLFTQIPPMVNEIIACFITVIVSSITFIVFQATKWGKKGTAAFTGTNEQTKFANFFDKLFNKKSLTDHEFEQFMNTNN